MYTYIHKNSYTYIHIYIYTYVHIYIYTYIDIFPDAKRGFYTILLGARSAWSHSDALEYCALSLRAGSGGKRTGGPKRAEAGGSGRNSADPVRLRCGSGAAPVRLRSGCSGQFLARGICLNNFLVREIC